jgi:hypothetical protein
VGIRDPSFLAQVIKKIIDLFLKKVIKLELRNEKKTKLHTWNKKGAFLGYNIGRKTIFTRNNL